MGWSMGYSVRAWSLGLCVGLGVCLLAGVTAAKDSLPQEMQSALRQNVAALAPLEVTWERARKSDLPVLEVLKRIKYEPTTLGEMEPYKVRFMCDLGKYYAHTWRYSAHVGFVAGKFTVDPQGPMHLVEEEASFDGTVCYAGNVMEQQAQQGTYPVLIKVLVAKAAKDEPGRWYFDPDFLFWAGFRMPRTPVELTEALYSLVLSEANRSDVVSTVVSREKIDGATLAVVGLKAANRTIRFLLDPEKGYAVRRRTENTTAGQRVTDAECSDFVKLDGRDTWLPRRINVSWHTWKTIPDTIEPKPLIREEFRLLEWKTDPIPAAQFALNYDVPGTTIKDGAVAGAEKFPDGYVNYRVPANPDDLDEVIATAVHGIVPIRGRTARLLAVSLSVVAILVTMGLTRWLRRRRSLEV